MNADLYDASLDNYGWLSLEVDRHEMWQAIFLGELLFETLHPRSVIDLGCSSGIYLTPFMAWGVTDVLGIDGARGVGQHIPGKFQVVDLRNSWTPPRVFDLAISIETGEHIRQEFHSTLVETISKCAPVVFWSAAPPGQGGEGHVGERPKSEWIELFATFGYGIHPRNNEIMDAIISHQSTHHCGWLRTNSVVFGKL